MFKTASVIRASVILLKHGGTLARVLSRCLKPYACVCAGILGGLSIVTMAIYLRRTLPPHPPQLLPWPYAWSFLKGFHCSLISLVPGNSDPSVPKAELRGNVLLKKKVTVF